MEHDLVEYFVNLNAVAQTLLSFLETLGLPVKGDPSTSIWRVLRTQCPQQKGSKCSAAAEDPLFSFDKYC
jgi:hypothetical protein